MAMACRATLRAYGIVFSVLPLFTSMRLHRSQFSPKLCGCQGFIQHGESWRLAPLISNTLLLSVIAVGCIWCGAIAGAVGIAIAHATPITTDEFGVGFLPRWAVGILCFFIGVVVSLPSVEAVEATVTALFVCYAGSRLSWKCGGQLLPELEEALAMLATEEPGGDSDYEDRGCGDYGSEYEGP